MLKSAPAWMMGGINMPRPDTISDADQCHIDAMIKHLEEESLRDIGTNLHDRNEAEAAAEKDRQSAMFFDKDTFESDGHKVPNTDGIYDYNKKTDLPTKPNVNNLKYWLEKESGEYFMSTNQGKEPYIWRDGYYTPGVEGYLRTLLEVVNGNDGVTATIINNIIHRIGSMALVDGGEIEQDWGDDTVLGNCVLNTKTCEISPHRHTLYVFSKLLCDYVEGATCPVWEEFLEYALPCITDQMTLQEMFGACLKRNYADQTAFFMLGNGGNGKGVVMNILRAMLGSGKTSAVPLQQVGDRFFSTDLYGRYANISGDTSPDALVDASTYKMLTGGDYIRAERKGKDSFEFRNHAKIINSMNELMATRDQSDGFFRRFVLIRFDATPTEKRVAEKKGFEDAIGAYELPGILNWAIDGLKRLNGQGGFTWQINKSVGDLRNIWNTTADPLTAFINECCELGQKRRIEVGVFMAAYTRWHEERHDAPPKEQQSDITVGARSRGFTKNGVSPLLDDRHRWLDDNGNERVKVKCYTGICLKNTSGHLDVDEMYLVDHWHEITGLAPVQPPKPRAKGSDGSPDALDDSVTKVRNAVMEILSENHTDAGARVRHISEKTGFSRPDVHQILLGSDEFVKTPEGDWKIGD